MKDSAEEKAGLLVGMLVALATWLLLHRSRRRDDEGVIAAFLQAGRGRNASHPGEIPAKGWKDILVRVWKSVDEDRILAVAAGVTFLGLLAIFPAIAAIVSLYGLFADPIGIARTLESLAGVLPGGTLDVIRDQIMRVASAPQESLGLGVAIGLAVSFWSANSGMKAVFDALNVAYDEKEKRGFFKLNLVSLAFTVAAILFLLVAAAVVVGVPLLLEHLPLQNVTEWLVHLLRWPVMLICVISALAVLYRYGPSRDKARWRWVTWGSAIVGIVWLGASALFSWYAANFGSYNETYGTLGAVIGFMTWLWISAIIVLLGAEINAEIEHQTVRDSTVGPPTPLGTRGATMADTVGTAHP